MSEIYHFFTVIHPEIQFKFSLLYHIIEQLMNSFLKFNKTGRQWHLPIVAGLTVGVPMILGWCIDNIEAGKLASLAGLSILYIQSDKLAERMILLMTCCFGGGIFIKY
jgi:hypothetical protein